MEPFDEEAIIARLREAFSPNTRSQSEVAKARREIATAVSSCIVYDENYGWKPEHVNPFPSEITGLRRRYLEALNFNIEARTQYMGLKSPDTKLLALNVAAVDASNILAHVEVSKYSRIHQEFQIRLRCANSLREECPKACDFTSVRAPQEDSFYHEDAEELSQSIQEGVKGIKDMALELRRATLRAHHQLERQKTLLADVKQRLSHDSIGVEDAKATGKARDTLVSWLDEKLIDTATDQSNHILEGRYEALKGQNTPTQIVEDAYEQYLAARRSLVLVADEAMRPLLARSVQSDVGRENSNLPKEPTFNDVSIVHALSQRLISILHNQANISLLRSYLSMQSSEEDQDTLENLRRIADESHLLSTYHSRTIDENDEFSRNSKAWIYAANAASIAVENTTNEHKRSIEAALETGHGGYTLLENFKKSGKANTTEKDAIGWKGIHGHVYEDSML